ncbi:hypothetical protein [Nitratireductor indicus]|nr:hypothetical protein [Nitratireductor indicus]SFQ10329.1 hypothetical protein SAMN05216176_101356 [Nitratireductor indicus]
MTQDRNPHRRFLVFAWLFCFTGIGMFAYAVLEQQAERAAVSWVSGLAE